MQTTIPSHISSIQSHLMIIIVSPLCLICLPLYFLSPHRHIRSPGFPNKLLPLASLINSFPYFPKQTPSLILPSICLSLSPEQIHSLTKPRSPFSISLYSRSMFNFYISFLTSCVCKISHPLSSLPPYTYPLISVLYPGPYL